eukprot:TRINITY_DN39866_c0_g1_i1.p1 TRINITY_DN39866_c0_g1~~TRINITY_DN39866_c0_g1_i1.p1  ORF type:complete len:818 (+),score=227.84 TRINITY_DN39866_c0_g1_i1:120-2573(+)
MQWDAWGQDSYDGGYDGGYDSGYGADSWGGGCGAAGAGAGGHGAAAANNGAAGMAAGGFGGQGSQDQWSQNGGCGHWPQGGGGDAWAAASAQNGGDNWGADSWDGWFGGDGWWGGGGGGGKGGCAGGGGGGFAGGGGCGGGNDGGGVAYVYNPNTPEEQKLAATVPSCAKNQEKPEDPVDLFGDCMWFKDPKRPRIKSEDPAAGDPEKCREPMKVLAVALGGAALPQAPNTDLRDGLFAQAIKLLQALLSFRGEGNCPPLLRGRVISKAAHHPVWRGISPATVITQWLNSQALLGVFAHEALRSAFDLAERRFQAQFVCFLLRCANLEAMQPGADPVRLQWGTIYEWFPEMYHIRALLMHLRRRCWEDSRDRSRSRSRSRDRKKKKVEEKKEEEDETFDGVRFFLKGCGVLDEDNLTAYFSEFGEVTKCSLLKDRRSKKSRGMGFVVVKPLGEWEGKTATEDMVRRWILDETDAHTIGVQKFEVTEAAAKPKEDEDTKHQERVEERKRVREDREARTGRVEGEKKLVPSPWAAKWRQEMSERLNKDTVGPVPLDAPKVQMLCKALWREVVEQAARVGGDDVKEALNWLKNKQGSWAFLPAADLLLVVGEGMVGMTGDGVFLSEAKREPLRPQTANLPSGDSSQGGGAGGNSAASQAPAPGGANHRVFEGGVSDECKIFIGGLTNATSLEQITTYFTMYGRITDAVVMEDKVTGRPRGFAFVVFDKRSCVDKVIGDYGKHKIDGKWVDVKRATPLPGSGGPEGAGLQGGGGDAVMQDVQTPRQSAGGGGSSNFSRGPSNFSDGPSNFSDGPANYDPFA